MAVTNLTDESASPVTQIFYLSIPVEHPLEDATSGAGRRWAEVLELIAESPGFLRLYWGRQVEESKKVQLHIGSSPSFVPTLNSCSVLFPICSFFFLISLYRRRTKFPFPNACFNYDPSISK